MVNSCAPNPDCNPSILELIRANPRNPRKWHISRWLKPVLPRSGVKMTSVSTGKLPQTTASPGHLQFFTHPLSIRNPAIRPTLSIRANPQSLPIRNPCQSAIRVASRVDQLKSVLVTLSISHNSQTGIRPPKGSRELQQRSRPRRSESFAAAHLLGRVTESPPQKKRDLATSQVQKPLFDLSTTPF